MASIGILCYYYNDKTILESQLEDQLNISSNQIFKKSKIDFSLNKNSYTGNAESYDTTIDLTVIDSIELISVKYNNISYFLDLEGEVTTIEKVTIKYKNKQIVLSYTSQAELNELPSLHFYINKSADIVLNGNTYIKELV